MRTEIPAVVEISIHAPVWGATYYYNYSIICPFKYQLARYTQATTLPVISSPAKITPLMNKRIIKCQFKEYYLE